MLNAVKLLTVLLIVASLCVGQQARKIAPSKPVKATAIVRTTPKATPAKSAPIRPATVTKTSYRTQATKATRTAGVRPAAGRYRQSYRAPARVVRAAYVQTPSADRYREIQQALADKGYFTSEVNGSWDQASIEALNKFKTDQKLRADGKLCSLSLIALGLGPKYEAINVQQLPPAPIPSDQQ